MKRIILYFVSTFILTVFLSGCGSDSTIVRFLAPPPIIGWSLDSIPFDNAWISPTDVAFINTKTGYILGTNGDLLKTTDYARTWTNTNIEPTGVMTRSISFINESTGFIYGTWNVLDGDSYGLLYKTTDGGLHWTKHQYPTAYNLYSLKFFDASNGIAINWTNAGSFLMTTGNGGATWEVANIKLDPPVSRLFYVGDICYATAYNQQIYKSVDRGKTWSTINTPASASNYLGGFYFLNVNNGFVNVDGKTYKTTDGGNNWNQINSSFPAFRTPFTPANYFHFCNTSDGIQIKDSIAYTGGDFPSFIGTTVYTTTNGGNKWVKSGLLKKFYFGNVVFVTDSLAYCISNRNIYTLRKKYK